MSRIDWNGSSRDGRFVLRVEPELHDLLRRAAADRVGGDQLLGVVVHGSWARGRATASSDVDLLVVVSRDLPLSRDLYQAWDRAPVTWEGHLVQPSFVHLPDPSEVPSGLWAEIALDGIILHERDLQVSRWLIRVRELIANGELLRREVHGQPYWVHERRTPR